MEYTFEQIAIKEVGARKYGYLAGFFDGEGCIRIGKTQRKRKLGEIQYQLIITVNQLNPQPLREFQREFGGSTHKKSSYKGFREINSWNISGNSALSMLQKLLPLLIVKKEEARVAVAFQRRLNGDKVTQEELEIRESLYKLLRDLKKVVY